ncbi:MAG: hypothetical protein PHH85_09160 [Candidatus Methanoperedens sp.]|nr:hypothetical protein [Candidatus Methanoperedens sp.]
MELLESAQQPEYKPHNAPILEGQQRLPQEMINKIDNYVHENQIDKIVNSPLLKILLISRIPEAQKYITENFGEYEPLIYDYVRSKYPSIYNLINQGENNAGLTNTPLNQTDIPENEENSTDENVANVEPISKELWESILDDMVEMDKNGYSPGKISGIIFDDHGVELTHQQVRTALERFKRSEKARLQAEAQEQEEEQKEEEKRLALSMAAQKRVLSQAEELRKVLAEKAELDKKLAVMEALEKARKPEITPEIKERKGVIRRLLAWVW